MIFGVHGLFEKRRRGCRWREKDAERRAREAEAIRKSRKQQVRSAILCFSVFMVCLKRGGGEEAEGTQVEEIRGREEDEKAEETR